MDAYELGMLAGRLKQADATEGWGASLGRAGGSLATGGSSIGGSIGSAVGGLGDKALGGAKSMLGWGSKGQSSAPQLSPAGTSGMNQADPFSNAFGQFLNKSTGGKYGGPGMSMGDMAGTGMNRGIGGSGMGNPFQLSQGSTAQTATPKGPGFLSGVAGGFAGGMPGEDAGLANTLGHVVGGEFDPLSPFRGGAEGVGRTLGDFGALAGAPIYGKGPWGMGVEAAYNRFAPEAVKRVGSQITPSGPGALVNGYRAFVPGAARAGISNVLGNAGQMAMSRGVQAANLGRTAMGWTPWAAPAARTAVTAGTVPAAASAFGLGAGATAGLAGYGAYALGQAPIDAYNVATGKTNLDERAAGQMNAEGPAPWRYLQNVAGNLKNPGEALIDLGRGAYQTGYGAASQWGRGSQLDQQLAAVKARAAAKQQQNPTPPAI